MMLTSLPTEVLTRVLSFLDTKTIATAATACTALRDAAVMVPRLKPVMTPRNMHAMMAWLELDHVRHRVISLRISRALRSTQYPALTMLAPWITGLTNLRSLSAAFCRLPPAIMHALPSVPLLNLHLHQFLPGVNDVFSTRLLGGFRSLRRAHITFAPGWTIGFVGPGLDDLHDLQTLELRRLPAIAITQPLRVTHHLALYALDSMQTSGSIDVAAPHAQSITLECDHASLEHSMRLPASLKSLKLRCPEYMDVHFIQHLAALELLDLQLDSFTLPDLGQMQALRMASFDARACIVFDTRSSLPPGLKAARAMCDGHPFDIYSYIDALSCRTNV